LILGTSPPSEPTVMKARVRAVGIVVLAALSGYAAGFVTTRPGAPSPSPSTAAIAPSATPTRTRPPSTGTPAPSQTPTPTATPPGAWVRAEFQLGERLQVEQIYGLEDRIVGLAATEEAFYIPTLLTPGGWSLSWVPSAISFYRAGAVFDGRLWFVAQVTGVVPEDVTWQLVSTTGDENSDWQSLGPTRGLIELPTPSDFDEGTVWALGRLRDTWAAIVWLDGNINEGITEQAIRWSRNGARWSDATVPELEDRVTFVDIDATRDVMLVRAGGGTEERPVHFVLVSRDGITWRRGSFPTTIDDAYDLACSPTTCVLTGIGLWADMPLAWVSEDGRTWTASETKMPDPTAPKGLRHVVATEAGFVALEEETNRVWASTPDGMRWQAFEVIPSDLEAPIVGLAAGGGMVAALEGLYRDGVWQGSWVGRLSALWRTE
jgi:hypothetical protein